jgi:hypothetical protein
LLFCLMNSLLARCSPPVMFSHYAPSSLLQGH